MDIREYYYHVFPKLSRGFEYAHYVLGYGQELISHGWDPNGLLVTVEPVDRLWDLSVEKGLEVFVPVVGYDSQSVLWPFDFEIYLSDPASLYGSPEPQKWFFERNVIPMADYLAAEFGRLRIPHVLDYTPSGGHFLTQVLRGTEAWHALASIGHLDDSALPGYLYEDPHDLKRNPGIKLDAAYVFSGMGLLSEYLAFRTMQNVPQHDLPMTLWDSLPRCMNIDLSWTADPAYMRIIRAPFSAHKKRSQRFRLGPEPLVDVMGRYYDGEIDIHEKSLDNIIEAMWDLPRAAAHAQHFPGYIPFANEGLVKLVKEYKASSLKQYHDYCHFGETSLYPGEALHRVLEDSRISGYTRNVVMHPYPRMLQPMVMRRVVGNLSHVGWHPRHIKDLFEDRYRDARIGWGLDFTKYSPNLKAWAFARQYSGEIHMGVDGRRL